MEKIYHVNTSEKKVVVPLLISDGADFKEIKGVRDKEGHYIMIKGSILQKDITVLHVYTLTNRTSNYLRQNLCKLQREIDETIY